ncbi:unnamed protein product [Ectocarpus sp. 12 AP-2014]
MRAGWGHRGGVGVEWCTGGGYFAEQSTRPPSWASDPLRPRCVLVRFRNRDCRTSTSVICRRGNASFPWRQGACRALRKMPNTKSRALSRAANNKNPCGATPNLSRIVIHARSNGEARVRLGKK